MTVRFNVKGYVDRRTADLIARGDNLTERLFKCRVARNPKEIARRERENRNFRWRVL